MSRTAQLPRKCPICGEQERIVGDGIIHRPGCADEKRTPSGKTRDDLLAEREERRGDFL